MGGKAHELVIVLAGELQAVNLRAGKQHWKRAVVSPSHQL